MTKSKEPNRLLRGLLAEAGWTEDFFARQVNAVAAESGVAMRLDRRSVTHWLAGRRPRSPVPELIAEALSRRLRRPVGLADLGLARPATGPAAREEPEPEPPSPAAGDRTPDADAPPRDVGSVLTGLAQSSESRRRMLSATAYRVAALDVPGWAQAAAGPPGLPPWPDPTGAQRLEPGQVATAEQMVRLFSDLDDSFGGGHARAELSCYLAFDIAPRLHAAGTPALRRRFFKAATQLTYLAAFMCFDDGCHGLGQQYYRAALRLAGENNDPAGYAVALRGMSVQAQSLGHRQHAVDLAESAAAISKAAAEPARQAFFLGQVAVAAAAAGDRHHALTAISAAERRLDQACSGTAADGGGAMGRYHPASLANQEAAVRALLGDRKGAIATLTEAARHRPQRERRSRALGHARLAGLHLDQGDLDQAVTLWHAFLDDSTFLTCGRATTAMNALRSRLHPQRTHRAVEQLLIRTATAWTPETVAS
ncbi:hypothetical protein [Streptomyces sp. NPDC093105]|uniref:hypothetical protein n=1 Tax=Streptomyces sp. NPDC093105 TaxID=3366029 RepID=UPI00380F42DF